MNMTEFWFKLVDMTKSDTPVFSIAGRALTEKQLLWIIGLVVLIIIVLLLRAAILWIFNAPSKVPADNTKQSSSSKVEQPAQPAGNTPTTVETSHSNEQANATKKPDSSQETPQSLLADTSEKKRSMQDYVTPDSIAVDVAKKSLTNDYPYQTLKPDPAMIGQVQATAVPPETKPKLPIEPQPTTMTVEPTIVEAEIAKEATTNGTQQQVNAESPPAVQSSALPTTAETTAQATTAPSLVTPINSNTAPVTTAPPSLQPVEQPKPVNSTLPPLPPQEPNSHMVVGVADESGQAIKKTTFNPADPVIP